MSAGSPPMVTATTTHFPAAGTQRLGVDAERVHRDVGHPAAVSLLTAPPVAPADLGAEDDLTAVVERLGPPLG